MVLPATCACNACLMKLLTRSTSFHLLLWQSLCTRSLYAHTIRVTPHPQEMPCIDTKGARRKRARVSDHWASEKARAHTRKCSISCTSNAWIGTYPGITHSHIRVMHVQREFFLLPLVLFSWANSPTSTFIVRPQHFLWQRATITYSQRRNKQQHKTH